MARNPEVKVTFKAFNKDFNRAMREMNERARKLRQEMKLQQERMKHTATDTQKLEARLRGLKREYEIAQQRTRHTANELERARRIWGQNSTAVKQMETALRRSQISEQQLANRITQTTVQLQKAKAAEQARTSELTKASAKLDQLKNRHEQLRSTMSRMNAEYDLQKAKLGANASETDKLRLKLDHLGRSHRAARMEVRNLENQLTQAKTKYASNNAEIEKYRASLNRAKTAERELAIQITATNAKLREQSNAALQATRSINTTGNKIQSAGATMTGAFAPAAVASGMAFKRMIGGSMEFEQATRRAATLTGGSYQQIKDDILDMAKDSVYSTGEVATAFADMGQKGFTAAQATDALPGVLKAAAASGEDLALVSNTITSALNAFNMEASESGRVADILAQGANQSAASVDELSHVFGYAAAPAHQLGISLEELTASAGLMIDAGIDGSKAGTALRSSFLRLVKPTDNADKMLKKLDVSITDNDGNMRSLAEIVRDLEEGMADYTDTQKAAALETIFGKEAVSGMLTLISAGPDEIEKMTKALEESEGASKKAADEMLDGWAGAMTKASSAADVAARTMTDSLAPALEKVADVVYWMSSKFAELPKPVQTGVASFAALSTVGLVLLMLLGLLANSVGGIISLFGMLGTKLFGAAGSAGILTKAFGAIRVAVTALTGPVGIIIGILTILIGAFINLYQTNEAFRETVNAVWNSITEKIGQAIEIISAFITEIFGQVVEWWTENQEKIREATANVWEWIQAFLETTFNWIVDVFQFVWPVILFVVEETWDAIKGVIQGVIDVILGIIDFFASLFIGDWEGLWNATKQILSGALEFILGLLNLWLIGRFVKLGRSFASLFRNIFNKLWNAIKGIFTRSVGAVRNVVSTGFNAIRNIITRIVDGIRNTISRAWNGIRSVTSTVFSGIRSISSSIWNGIRNSISTVVNGIRTRVTGVWNSIRTTTSSVWNRVRDAMVRPVERARDSIKRAIDRVKGFFSGLKLRFPKIKMPKLPRFKLKGKFSLAPPSVPKVSVEWHAKGGIFRRPTIFNTNSGFHGVGEAGPEAILPLTDRVLGKIGEMIAKTMPQQNQEIIVRAGDVYIDGERAGKVLWKPVKNNIDRDEQIRKIFKGDD